MIYLGNAFSLNMLKIGSQKICLEIEPVAPEEIPEGAVSIVGHDDTAAILANYLGRACPVNRATITLTPDDLLFIAQYRGPRLPAGADRLPPEASLEFYRIRLNPADGTEAPIYFGAGDEK